MGAERNLFSLEMSNAKYLVGIQILKRKVFENN